jgi:hypothetical protein
MTTMRKLCVILILLVIPAAACNRSDIYGPISHQMTLSSIRVEPTGITVPSGDTVRFRAYAVYTDGSSVDISDRVTWSTSGSAAWTPTGSPGFYTASTTGTTNIIAGANGVTSTDSDSDGVATSTSPATDIFVSPTGSDVLPGNGSMVNPFATIDHALLVRTTQTGIRIASGNYTTTQITLVEGVSLYGGYSATDWTRDIDGNVTIIEDTSSSGGIPKGTVSGDNTISLATVLEGLVIQGSLSSSLSATCAVYLTGGSPTIRKCMLRGGGIGSSTASYGLYITGGNPVIAGVSIDGGSSSMSCGISISGTTNILIMNSLIDAGSGTTLNTGVELGNTSGVVYVYNNIILSGQTTSVGSSFAIYVSSASAPMIANNTVSTGNAINYAYGVRLGPSAKPNLNNNIFVFPSGFVRIGIIENDVAPTSVNNNIFYNTTDFYRDSGLTYYSTIFDMETYLALGINGSGNIAADPLFVSSTNLHLAPGSPALLNGLNGIDKGFLNFPTVAGIPIDLGKNPRPAATLGPWSIGAYQ